MRLLVMKATEETIIGTWDINVVIYPYTLPVWIATQIVDHPGIIP
jgi:hypothetical protein